MAMEIIISILIGILYTAGVYLLLRRSLVKLILGIIFLSNATNLLIFMSAGLTRGKPDFIAEKGEQTAQAMADPLPQALVLTAIVIGFGIVAFTLTLKYKHHKQTGTYDLDQVKQTDQS
jgi:multicomponent Na+:H+ antiporter subunit C